MYLILDNCQGNPGWADAMAKILESIYQKTRYSMCTCISIYTCKIIEIIVTVVPNGYCK